MLSLPRSRFAHRYQEDGIVELICIACLNVVCHIEAESDAHSFLEAHVCEGDHFDLYVKVHRDRSRAA